MVRLQRRDLLQWLVRGREFPRSMPRPLAPVEHMSAKPAVTLPLRALLSPEGRNDPLEIVAALCRDRSADCADFIDDGVPGHERRLQQLLAILLEVVASRDHLPSALQPEGDGFGSSPLCRARRRVGSSRPVASIPQVLRLDLEHLAKTRGHRVGIRSTAAFVVADHVLADAHLVCQLSLSQSGLQTGTCQQIADAIPLHLLPVLGALDRNELIVRLVSQDGDLVSFHCGNNITCSSACGRVMS